MIKKKQCSGTKGYSCGRSCISVKKVCRKDGLAGQSVKILNNFVKEIESKPAPESAAPSREGIEWGYGALKRIQESKKDTVLSEEWFNLDPITDAELAAVIFYTGSYSRALRKMDAGFEFAEDDFDESELKELRSALDTLNNFIDTYPTRVPGTQYHGFRKDMLDVYNVSQLKAGSEFSFPSVTSLSKNQKTAEAFNGGGVFVIKDAKKNGVPVAALSNFEEELEVLVNKNAKYRVVSINNDTTPVYTLEEI